MAQQIILPPGDRTEALLRLSVYLNALPADKPWRVNVEPLKRARSDEQNRALWGVAYKTLEEETGNDPEDLHCYFCGEYFGWVEYELFGRKRLKPRRTTTRDEAGRRDVIPASTFSEFYAFIQRRAAETIGAYVPDPGESAPW